MAHIVITLKGDKYEFIGSSKEELTGRDLITLRSLNNKSNVRFLQKHFIEQLDSESLKLLKEKYPELFI